MHASERAYRIQKKIQQSVSGSVAKWLIVFQHCVLPGQNRFRNLCRKREFRVFNSRFRHRLQSERASEQFVLYLNYPIILSDN